MPEGEENKPEEKKSKVNYPQREFWLIEEAAKDTFGFARTLLKVIRSHGENGIPLLSFLGQLINPEKNKKADSIIITTFPLIGLPFHYATDSYYPNPMDTASIMLSAELAIRNDVLSRVKDTPDKRQCFKVDTRKGEVQTLDKADGNNIFAWTTKFPDLYMIQTIDTYFPDLLIPQKNKTVRNPKDRRVTEYLAYIPKESQTILSRAKLPPPCPYDQIPTLFRGKIYRN